MTAFTGASVIRMTEHFLGHNNFVTGIRDYLNAQ